MLLSLHIRDFAIIDELELDLHTGMTALTGETGAGKSILLDALGLLLGDRADSAVVRYGAERADVSAGFDIAKLETVRHWLDERDLAVDGECQLRRVIFREGRSRAYINASPVPAQSLRELGEFLVDIHGQHEHQSLMKRDLQRQLLDQHGGHLPLAHRLADTVRAWNAIGREIEAIIGNEQGHDSRLEFLRFQLQELEELAAQNGEAEQLHEELARLSNASRIIETVGNSIDSLYEEDSSVHARLGHAISELETFLDIDPSLGEANTLLDNALVNLQEGIDLLRDYRERLEQDPHRLAWVEGRLDDLHRVARKHRREPEALPDFQQQLESELAQLEGAGQRLELLQQQRSQLESDYQKTAENLHKKRVKTAKTLSRQVSLAMQSLGMKGGRFNIQVSASNDPTPLSTGSDKVDFQVTANPGQPLGPLARVASGGELSRISLAIQVVAAQDAGIPTLIFDEVDSGVGGAVAETVGQQLQTLGLQRQVLCVTHLPQVAAQAHQHLQVSKLTGDNTTRTQIRPLGSEERVEEIARMLGGQKITASTLEHAREMLRSAQPDALKTIRTSD